MKVLMLQMVSRLLPQVSLVLATAVATHLVMSFAQTLMHAKLGHHRIGGKFFRNHINFHHAYYSKDHLVSPTYLGEEGNNTPFFFIPVFLVGGAAHARRRFTRTSFSTRNITSRDRDFSGLHGSGANRNCTSSITDMPTQILR
jgi:hypothetical protein